MRKIVFFISIIIIIIGVIYLKHNNFFTSPTAYAVGDLIVNWGVSDGDPIFTISNAAPGDVETRTVQINNGATTTRPLGIKAESVSHNPSNFPTVLKVKITEGAATLYEKTLQEFYVDSLDPNGVALGNINAGSTRTIDIELTFDINAGNEFQNASVVFDLIIGLVSDIPQACSGMRFNAPTIFGTQDNDTINATSKNEMIVVFEGNDTVRGMSGNDCIIGLSGIKNFTGGSGNDVLVTGDGNNRLDGESGIDIIESGNGNSEIRAGAGNDKITLGNGNNRIFADAGNDEIVVGTGNNTAKLGAGNDKFTGTGGNNNVNGESGNDDINNGNSTSGSVNGSSGRDKCIALTELQCEL